MSKHDADAMSEPQAYFVGEYSAVVRDAPRDFVNGPDRDRPNPAIVTSLRRGECVFVTPESIGQDWLNVLGGALAAGGSAERGDRGWLSCWDLVTAETLGHGSNDKGKWQRIHALGAVGYMQPTRKHAPAEMSWVAGSWVWCERLLAGDEGGNPLDQSDWWSVREIDSTYDRDLWVQAADFEPKAATMLDELARFVGRPYIWGGSDGHGLDCSGMVTHAARWRVEQHTRHTRHDLAIDGHAHWLPHSARRQFGEEWPALQRIGDDRTVVEVAGDVGDTPDGRLQRRTLGEQARQRWMPVMQPGDLAYFAMGGADNGRIDHVGFIETIADDGRVTLLHASSAGTGGQPQGPCIRRETLLPPESKAFENKLAARWVGLRRFTDLALDRTA